MTARPRSRWIAVTLVLLLASLGEPGTAQAEGIGGNSVEISRFDATRGARVALEAGKQGKHIVGHKNLIPGRSPLTHKNPQGLLNRFAGRGTPVRGRPGQPGYRERVNFGEDIGWWVHPNTGVAYRTTNGIIHYSSRGAHIVPARP